jgi:phage host-nuclease inhibitor protein Gam
MTLHRDPKIPTIKEAIKEFCHRYRDRLKEHPNNLAVNLMKGKGIVRRFKRKRPTNLFKLIFHI